MKEPTHTLGIPRDMGMLQSVEAFLGFGKYPSVRYTAHNARCSSIFWRSGSPPPAQGRIPTTSYSTCTPSLCAASSITLRNAFSMISKSSRQSERNSYSASASWAMVFTEVPPEIVPTLNVVFPPCGTSIP